MRSFRSGSGSQRGDVCSLSCTPQSLAKDPGTTCPFPWGSLLSTVVTKPSYTVVADSLFIFFFKLVLHMFLSLVTTAQRAL